jgi:WS/DGAT/MGAT family acyltransferase
MTPQEADMREQLTPLDASFLELEQADECSHMHIGWAMVFDPRLGGGAPSVEEVRSLLEERLDAMPRFRKRLSHPRTGGLRWPRWEPHADFDVADHVRHVTLPAPGGEAELLDWMADFYSHRLDRSRPLWEITLVDGLEGGRWSLVTKIHHCLVDGMSGVSVTNLLLDPSPHPAPQPSTREDDPAQSSQAPAATGRHYGPATLARGARAGIDLAMHPGKARDALGQVRALAEFLVRDEVIAAPQTSLNVPIGGTRRMRHVAAPLADLKAVKSRLGGSVNDVVLAIAAGGIRALLESRGERLPARGVRVMVPVSIRDKAESMSLGNRVSSLFVELPVAEEDALRRYTKTVTAAEKLKRSGLSAGAETLMGAAGIVPPVLHGTLARLAFKPRLFNITITNVPGPQQTLYAFGAPLRRVIPLVPIFADHAVGFAVASYDGEVVFGLNADHGAMADLDVLADGLTRSLDELRDIVGIATPAATGVSPLSPATI